MIGSKLKCGLFLGLMSLLASCSSNEFSKQAQIVDKACLDSLCTTYRVTENAFNPAEQNKTDILFVFDNSPSMKEDNLKLAEKMDGFITELNNNNVDYNLCYTLSEMASFQSGRVLNWTNGATVLQPGTPNIESLFLQTIDDINNNTAQSQEEQPIAATSTMINSFLNQDCLRPGTPLNVVFLTDEDENSCGQNCGLQEINTPEALIQTAKNSLGEVPFLVHSIIAHPSVSDRSCYELTNNIVANTHASLSNLTGGVIGDICASSYVEPLSSISEKIQDTLDSVVIKCDPISDIRLTAENGMTFEQELRDGRLYLTPGIPVNVNVTVEYDCAQP